MEAIGLRIESLREFGITVPAADRLAGELDHQLDHLYRWLDQRRPAGGLPRPEPRHGRLVEPGGAADLARARPGPSPCSARPAPAALAAVARAATTPPATWFEPIESGLHEIRRARDGLVAGGELAMAGYTYHEAVYYLLDCAPTLDSFVAEVEAGLAFVRRTDSEQTGQVLDSYRWLAVLRGESADAAGEAVPSTGTPTTRWRFSSLMSARRSRPPLARIPDITPVSPTRTASASRADPARPSVVSPRHAAERWGGAPRPDAG